MSGQQQSCLCCCWRRADRPILHLLTPQQTSGLQVPLIKYFPKTNNQTRKHPQMWWVHLLTVIVFPCRPLWHQNRLCCGFGRLVEHRVIKKLPRSRKQVRNSPKMLKSSVLPGRVPKTRIKILLSVMVSHLSTSMILRGKSFLGLEYPDSRPGHSSIQMVLPASLLAHLVARNLTVKSKNSLVSAHK